MADTKPPDDGKRKQARTHVHSNKQQQPDDKEVRPGKSPIDTLPVPAYTPVDAIQLQFPLNYKTSRSRRRLAKDAAAAAEAAAQEVSATVPHLSHPATPNPNADNLIHAKLPHHYDPQQTMPKSPRAVGGGCIGDDYNWIWELFWDSCRLEAHNKAKQRLPVEQSVRAQSVAHKHMPCYSYDEMRRYSTNRFYRAFMAASLVSSQVGLLLQLYLVYCDSRPSWTYCRWSETSSFFNSLLFWSIILTSSARLFITIFASATLLTLTNLVVLVLAYVHAPNSGRCLIDDKMRSKYSVQLSSMSLFVMALIKRAFTGASDGEDKSDLTLYLTTMRCKFSSNRWHAFQLMHTAIDLLMSLRLLFLGWG